MTENESQDEDATEDNTWPESIEELDKRNFELDTGDESGGSGGFRLGGPAVDPYGEGGESDEEETVEPSDTE